MATPSINFNMYGGGTNGSPSYFDISISSSSYSWLSAGSFYDAWCLNPELNVKGLITYSAYVYSSMEVAVWGASISTLSTTARSKLDEVNWLLNYFADKVDPSVTFGDVQAAIWTLNGYSWASVTSGLATYSQSRVDALVTAANGHNGYVPDIGDPLALVLDPWTSDGAGGNQPLITTVKAAGLGDFVWEDADADGIQDANEKGIAGAKVELVRDLNGDGSISSDEVLSSTITDANGNYKFTGLTPGFDYQVRFSTPTGYTNTSPRQADGSSTSGTNSEGALSNVVRMTPGEYNQTIDSGFYKLASLGDRVWNDSNGNGKQDTGETGRSGVTVELYNCGTSTLVATTTTDTNGNYLFSDLKPGTYHVKFYAPTGTSFTTVDVLGDDATDSDAKSDGITGCYTLNSGDKITTVDAGLVPLGSLGDRVWVDTNANGQQDVGEVGKSGVTVQLLNRAGTVIGTQTTDTSGNYLFTNLAAGTYSVQFGSTTGYKFTGANTGIDATDSDADSTTGKTGTYTLGVGETNLTVDAGIYQLASLGDRVWNDGNSNGKQDTGETGRSGVKVELYNCTTLALVATTTTDANGNYLFSDLKPGTYHVKFYAPTGTSFTTVDVGDDSLDSDSNSSGISGCYTLNSGDKLTTVDAGLVPLGSLGDRVWVDTNANGQQDAGEVGKSGVTVQLLNSAGTVIGTQTTDVNGSYLFTNLAAGTYSVQFGSTTGYKFTGANTGVDTTDSDADATSGRTGTYTLGVGETNLTVDAGIYQLASLGDRVWNDTNGNGKQDTGETGRAGIKVELYTCPVNGQAERLVATTTTNANGNYLFDNLTPGTYHVKFYAPDGTAFTKLNTVAEPNDSDAGTDGVTGCYTLKSGEDNVTVDAGLVTTAALGDKVWWDLDGNGRQNSGEPGVAGVTVILTEGGADNIFGTADDTQQRTTTDASGLYHFYDLTPDVEYRVRFMAPNNMTFTKQDVGSDSGDSDAATNGTTVVVKLDKQEQNFTIDAGLVRTDGTNPDTVAVCEDRSVAFNVLDNDKRAVKLLSVAHESNWLDNTFEDRGGALSFTGAGRVVYKTMADYYGFDKLVYTAVDADGAVYTETVSITVRAVSDAPDAGNAARYHWDHDGGSVSFKTNSAGIGIEWVREFSLAEFGTFSDAEDKLQQFGTYNADVANDVDTLKAIRLYGLTANAGDATILFNGKALNFSNGQTYDISVADIKAGKLDIKMTEDLIDFPLKWAYVDTGSVDNNACYDGTVVSSTAILKIWTPIALDLSGDGKIGVTGETSSYQKDASAALGHTVSFDIDGDGKANTIEWFNGSGDGILIDNRDGHAASDMSGLRLFGDQGGEYGNGFYKLAAFDLNGDHKLSGEEIRGIELWMDNGDAIVQSGEIRTLADFGIAEISTQLVLSYDADNKLHIGSTATRADGSKILTEDVFFASAPDPRPDLSELLSDEGSLAQMLTGKNDASGTEQAFGAAAAANDGSHSDLAAASEAAQVLRHLIEARHGAMELHAA